MNIDTYEESEEYRETEEERRIRDERFVEEFFTERELKVNYDKTSEPDEKNAQAWYEAVEKTISRLPIYQHDNVGQPPRDRETNESDEENNQRTKANSQTESDVWFFRGQKDSCFAFTSTLYRRLVDASSGNLSLKSAREIEQAMLQAELSLLNKARKMGIGRGLTALETLTLLQHHGSPTRLIDITSDWRVALYFACESDDDRDGRMFLIKIDPNRWNNFPKEQDTSKQAERPAWHDYRRNFDEQQRQYRWHHWLFGTWPILLPFSDPRMISQRGFFLVGGVPLIMSGSMLPTYKPPGWQKKIHNSSDSAAHPQTETICNKKPTQTELNPSDSVLRKISSMTILFDRDLVSFDEIGEVKQNDWSAVGYSIRVPKSIKRTLRKILRDKGVHADSIYPPLRETVRLFEHVVDESLKK